jgi:hypothetical protein
VLIQRAQSRVLGALHVVSWLPCALMCFIAAFAGQAAQGVVSDGTKALACAKAANLVAVHGLLMRALCTAVSATSSPAGRAAQMVVDDITKALADITCLHSLLLPCRTSCPRMLLTTSPRRWPM